MIREFVQAVLFVSMYVVAFLLLAIALAAGTASAQTATPTPTPTPRPDVKLQKTAGVYNITCRAPSDTDLASVCFVRSDAPGPIELGCKTAAPSADVALAATLTVTDGNDAEIRCYAVDDSGLVSDYSENAGLVDFTKPGRPHVK